MTINKPIKKYPINEKYYNYRECVKYIEKKHNIKLDDYHRKFGEDGDTTREYYSFWHKVLDRYGGFGEDGGAMFLSDARNTYNPSDDLTIEITDLFLAEFGEGSEDDRHVPMWVEID